MIFKKIQFNLTKKITSFLILAIFISIFGFYNQSNVINLKAVSLQESQLTTQYQAKKQEIENRKAQVESSFIQAGETSSQLGVKVNSLQEEIAQREAEIKKVESLILEVKNIITEIEKQQVQLEIKIKNSIDELIQILRETQNEIRIPLIEKLFSGSIADGLKRTYYLNDLNDQAKTLILKIDNDKKELELNKQSKLKSQSELEDSQYLLQSKKSSLQVLLEQTKGEQAKYEELTKIYQEQANQAREELLKENAKYVTDINSVRAEEARKAEILRKEEEARRKNTPTTGNNSTYTNNGTTGTVTGTRSGGYLGCWWETQAPSVPAGYFGYPSNGRLTNPLICGGQYSYNHDGLDIAGGMGTALVATANGKVVRKGAPVSCIGMSCNGGFGNYIILEHIIPSGKKIYALYAHMQYESQLDIGTSVSKGQQVGSMGCTGNTSPYPCGVHLHFMMIADTLDNGISCIYSGAKCINPLSLIS